MAKQSVITEAPRPKTMVVRLIGDTPLICNRFLPEALEGQGKKKGATPRKDQNPEQEFKDSLYPCGDGYGFPASGFKKAAVSACRMLNEKMTIARAMFHVVGDLVPITGSEPRMREDIVRVGRGAPRLRYRGEFPDWECALTVRFNEAATSIDQVVSLLVYAGFHIGVGDWRPEKGGSFGCFHVAQEGE